MRGKRRWARPEAAGYIASWRPSSVTPQAAAFARQVVAEAGAAGRERAKNLLWAAGRLADWAIGLGLDPVPEVLLHPSVIERFTAHAPGLTGGDAADAAHQPAVPGPRGGPAACPGGRAAAPRARQGALQPRARSTATSPWPTRSRPSARRMRAAGLVCLAAGAGLIRVRPARRPRHRHLLPVRRRHRRRSAAAGRGRCRCWPATTSPLLGLGAFAGSGLVTGGTDPARQNVTNPLARSLAGGTGLPRLDTSRLRATWLADCAQLLGLATFMHAAGITCSQRLGDITATLEPGSEEQAVTLLGRAAR